MLANKSTTMCNAFPAVVKCILLAFTTKHSHLCFHEQVLPIQNREENLLTLAALEIELGEFKPTSCPRIRFISSVVPFAF